jgi:hypothetical protein
MANVLSKRFQAFSRCEGFFAAAFDTHRADN